MNPSEKRRVLVTGATGYIGSRLVPMLLGAGYDVRCLARDARKLAHRCWADHPNVEVVECDAGDFERLADALSGCHAAYYLIHSMIAAGGDYRAKDLELAGGFARACGRAGVDRIVYLGGLGETGAGLSEHLSSRREVESALSSGPVRVTTLRAAMIIGSGSASFEILRYLVERLPVMVTPRWVQTECQPISVRDALRYLVACLATPETVGQTIDIGGPEVARYREILERVARSLGLSRRIIVPVPLLTPRLSSLWIHLITPLHHRIARPLAEGLKNRVVCRDDRARSLMPFELLTIDESIEAAVRAEAAGAPESRWTDAGPIPGDPDWAGGQTFSDRRSVEVEAGSDRLFACVCGLGGRQGWYSAGWLWRLRGFLDRILGGPGLGRGRRRLGDVEYGDALDFWRVTGIDRGRRLVLSAEMKLPGRAVLEFEVDPLPGGRSHLTQLARFQPRGLAGLLYWFLVYPVHGFVFERMLLGIKQAAERAGDSPATHLTP